MARLTHRAIQKLRSLAARADSVVPPQVSARPVLLEGSAPPSVRWARITGRMSASGKYWLKCRLLRWNPASQQPEAYGDELDVEVWGQYIQSWDETHPQLAVGDDVMIVRPSPHMYPSTASAWYLWTPVRGTCAEGTDNG